MSAPDAKVQFRGYIKSSASKQKFDQEGAVEVMLQLGIETVVGTEGPAMVEQLVAFQRNGDVDVTIAPRKFRATIKKPATVAKVDSEKGVEIVLQLALEVVMGEHGPDLVEHLVQCQMDGEVGVTIVAAQLELDYEKDQKKGRKKKGKDAPAETPPAEEQSLGI